MKKPNVLNNLKFEATYAEFLDTVKVLKMLYGRDVSEKFFTDNIKSYYDIDSESLSNVKEQV